MCMGRGCWLTVIGQSPPDGSVHREGVLDDCDWLVTSRRQCEWGGVLNDCDWFVTSSRQCVWGVG